jgi:AsmA protein
MVKAIKWTLIFGAGLGALLVIAIVSLPFFINPNDYKAQISSMIEGKTGRVITMPGDISLQVSPTLDIVFSLGEVQIGSGKGFPDTQLVTSKLAEIQLALWPLLTKQQLQINNLDLSGVQLNLIRRQDGTTNWAAPSPVRDAGGAGQTAPPPIEQPGQEQGQKPLLAGIDIGGINIRDINVKFDDQQAGKTISLNNFNLNVGHIREGVAFPVATDFEFIIDDKKQPLSGTVKTDFKLSFDLGKQHFIVNGLTLAGLLAGESLPASKLALTIFADAEINLGDEKVTVHKFNLKHGDFIAETALSMTGFKQPVIKGTLTVPKYSLKSHLAQLGISPPSFSDPKVMESLSASLAFVFGNDQLQIKDVQVQLDDTAIRASGSVANFKPPVFVLQVHLDQLDLDRYAVKKAEETSSSAPTPKTETGEQVSGGHPLIPVQLLKDLRFKVDIGIDSLRVAKLNLSAIKLQADGKDGLINIKPFSAKLYDGSIVATGKIDVRPSVPVVTVNKKIEGVQVGPMFVDMTGKEEISGTANVVVNLKTRGVNRDELTRNSNGTVNLALEDGIIKRLEILQAIRMAKALLEQKAVSHAATSQPTAFATLTASGMLVNGIFKNDDLKAVSELMKVTGKGQVDFVQEQIDYLLTIYLTDRVERDEATGLVELGKMAIPYRVKGSFTNIQQSAALEELFKAKAKELLFDTIQDKLGTDTDAGKEEPPLGKDALIDKGLRGLFGN